MDYRRSHLAKGDEYDRYLENNSFDAYMKKYEEKILLHVISKLFPKGIDRYLDFACGTGRITNFIEQFAEESYGIDVSSKMMEEAQKKCCHTKFLLKDITRDEVDLKPVDLVTAFRFFPNAEETLRKETLSELSKIVKPGKYIIINSHRNPWSIRNLIFSMITQAKADSDLHYLKLKKLLRNAGFSISLKFGVGLWIIRAKYSNSKILNSYFGEKMEFLSKLPGLVPLCPDIIIVARRL